MRKYISFFRLRFIDGLQYRTAAYSGIACQFFWGSMRILMFLAFYKANLSKFPMGFEQLSSYIWLQQAFFALFSIWTVENDIFDCILNGNIAYELCRPIDLYNMWFTKIISNRVSKTVLRCMPILIIAFILPKPYSISIPKNLFMFLISMLLSLLIVVSFNIIIYILSFFTLSPSGIRIVSTSLVEFLSGAIIPIPFLPDKVRIFVELLPFASMQNVPFRIYSGNISGSQLIFSILLQIFWLFALIILGKLIMSKALKCVIVQGG